MTIVAGIDPGLSGAVAFFFPMVNRVSVYDMPLVDGEVSGAHLAQIIRWHMPTIAVIEHVHSMPKQGVKSMFNFGRAVGVAKGVFGALDIPLHSVTPQRWKSQYGLIKQDKDASRKLAIEMFPITAGQLKRKKDHGRAEAILIAAFGADKTFLKTTGALA